MAAKKVIVLGAGLIGATIAGDLAADSRYDVTVADADEIRLTPLKAAGTRTLHKDLSIPDAVKELAGGYDLVLGALPSALGFAALRAVIEAGKPCVDISFMSEDPLELDAFAREKGVTAVVDCGVAPGLSNMIIGHCYAELDATDSISFYVGGLPRARQWPYQYKAPFAPLDVIEEYTRPVRMIEYGEIVIKPALSEPEFLEFDGIGTLEAFNTDGLRSLVKTIHAPNMKEKTLRYPGHRELMLIFRETGFFDKTPIDLNGSGISPLDMTARILFPLWRRSEGEEEFTVMRVLVEGTRNGKRLRHVYELFDQFDPETGWTSMARTTGFPCTIIGRMVAEGVFDEPGVHPPERLGSRPGLLSAVLESLAERGVRVQKRVEEIGS